MDRRHHRRGDEPGVGEREEVEPVVDDVELVAALEDLRDVQALGHLGIDGGVLRPARGDDRGRRGRRERVAGGEEGHVVARATSPSVSSEANSSQGP